MAESNPSYATCDPKSGCCGPAQSQPTGSSCCGPAKSQPTAASSCCGPSNGSSKSAGSACCAPSSAPNNGCCAAPSQNSESAKSQEDAYIKDSVKEYYGEVLKSSNDLKTSACCTKAAPPSLVRDILRRVPQEVISKYYGCGSPFPMGIKGLRVLDLGCGSGRDCYVCSALVGEKGFVTGIDMTPAQLEVAQNHLADWTSSMGYAQPNIRFLHGEIEQLDRAGIEEGSVDIAISNCVINLSPDKEAVLRQVYRALARGGEMYFSDVYCDRRLPAEIRKHPVLVGECLGGALYLHDFTSLCRKVGFRDPRMVSSEPLEVHDPELKALLGEAQFFSITFRLFKLPDTLEDRCEDYGQVAVYKGTIPTHMHGYDLDDSHHFTAMKPMLVCGNTATMIKDTWLAPHFNVTGDTSVHYGLFDCTPKKSTPHGGPCGSCM